VETSPPAEAEAQPPEAAAREAPVEDEPEPAEPAASEPVAGPERSDQAAGEGLVDLNSAGYEELRDLRLSVTQTGRVLALRERSGGFKSVDELDSIPGFPRDFLLELKQKVRV
jgi:DNA uptake protein ComE-like DNA-binding protein